MELKIETLYTAQEYIKRLKESIEKLVQAYRDEKIEEDMLILDIIEGLRWTIDVMVLTKDIHVGSAKDLEMKDKLKELLDAFEQADHTLIADIFEYEIVETLNNYEDVIESTLKVN